MLQGYTIILDKRPCVAGGTFLLTRRIYHDKVGYF
jgi:hypothetical protein